jgi:arginine/ornithine N-succinyltransferase beta subunit
LFKKDIETRFLEKKAYALFTAFRFNFQKEVLRELRGVIALREEVVSVTKRYEE